ncbi:MAG: NAD-dependent epimerase/dehydratase family protein [Verrucomicrobiota bacterium]
MKVVITGGGGFIGGQLAKRLSEKGTLVGPSEEQEEIDSIVLFDSYFSPAIQQDSLPHLTLLNGDLSKQEEVFSAIDQDEIAVFHLAAMVSGECEREFDNAISVNLDGTRYVLEALRETAGTPRVVFASSVGSYGGEDMPDQVDDLTKQTPMTTYGMTKVIGELMINDYSRKGFLDGRSARLPTVIIRPGKPNAAASSWASGMFREPLNGETCYLPVHRDQCHPVLGYRDVVDSFIALHEADPSSVATDRAYVLPSHRVSVSEALTLLQQVAEERSIPLGLVIDEFDPVIQAIVDTWPNATDGTRALQLGVPTPRSVKDVIRDYIDDFLEVPES